MKQQKITINGKIVQIVEQKDWRTYFNFKTDGEVVDVLNIRPIDEPSPPRNAMMGFMQWLSSLPLEFYRTIRNIIYCDTPYLNLYYDTPYFAKCPHNYRIGDYVDIEITISQPKLRAKIS